MTSNIGARYIEKKGRVGFQSNDEEATSARIGDMVMGEVKKTFNPEFINRIDEIIVFDALNDDDLRQIVVLLASQMNDVLKDKKLHILLTPDAVDWVIRSTCQDRSYGARPLRRALQKYVEDPLSEAFIRGTIKPGQPVEIFANGDRLGLRQTDAVEEPLSV
jgi:ATP-dependent Clp protease ATP-binding subunit ClpC